jgi:threonine dehydrogenase-like Zn-dependent dehydrogenase
MKPFLLQHEPVCNRLSNVSINKGVDGVIITASTKYSDPVSQAARMSRKRGRIILVGVTGLGLFRILFYVATQVCNLLPRSAGVTF